MAMIMHSKNIITAGRKLKEARKAIVMLHGRGASALDIIMSLTKYLHVDDYAVLAPEATNHTWYPYSFLVPPGQNEPWLTSALALIDSAVGEIQSAGIAKNNIYFAGFSQGACLTLEYVARNACKWGGVCAFTGGLIGDKVYSENYKGDFEGTSFFIGTSDPDPHVPVERVKQTEAVLNSMHATVTTKIYPGMGHTVSEDEILQANNLVFR